MRVEQLELLAYGHYGGTELDLSGPPSGLTIVVGPNEAGKSTARRALLAALWGFARGAPDAYRYGPAGLRLGMTLRSAGRAELHAVRQGAGRGKLVDAEGRALPEDAMAAFVGGTTRELYEHLFCVDHDELRLGSEALLDTGGEIGRLVFGAALGARSLSEVLRRLDSRAGELYKENGRRQPVVESLAAYRDAMRQARELRVRSRDVDRRRQAVEDAQAQVLRLRSELEERRAELARSERIGTALPLVAQRSELLRSLGDLEREGVLPTADWAKRAAASRAALEGLDNRRSEAAMRRSRLEAEISSFCVDPAVLARAGQIELVVEGLDRYKNNAEDLPERQGRLRVARQRVEDCHRRLGITAGQEAGDWVVSDGELALVEDLAAAHAALTQAVRTAAEELAALDAEIEDGERRLEALPAPVDVGELVRALALAAPLVVKAADLPAAHEQIGRLRSDAAALASRLGLGHRTLDEVEGVPAPSSAEVTAAVRGEEVLAERRKGLEEERERHALRCEDLGRALDELTRTRGVPEPEQLEAARQHREAGWMLVRRALLTQTGATWASEVAAWVAPGSATSPSDARSGVLGGPDDLVVHLAGGYETAVVDADAAADERYAHAEDLSKLGQLRAQYDEASLAGADIERRLVELDDQMAEERRHWAERWARIGVEARHPAEMVTWLEDHGRLLSAIDEIKSAEQRAGTVAQEVAEAAAIVDGALQRLDASVRPQPGAPLALLVARAQEIVDAARDRANAREGTEKDLERARASRVARSRALDDARERLGDWERSWSAALVPLRLAARTPAPVALATVRALRDLANARADVGDLEGRIRGIERDMAAYGSLVEEAASGLRLGDAADPPTTADPPTAIDPLTATDPPTRADPLTTAASLRDRLRAAREAETSRRVLRSQLDSVGEELETIDAELSISTERLQALRDEARCGSEADVRSVADRAIRADSLRRQIADRETTLLEQGGGRTLDAILAEVAGDGADGDRLAARVATLHDDIEGLEADLEAANQSLGEARKDLEAVTDAGTAADMEQRAQGHLALAASAAAEYARTAVAAVVLRQVVAAYGERHRGPILERAGTIFSDVTTGAFTQLLTDTVGDQQVVLAQRRNAEVCAVDQLSDGARDQLYFALRLAGIEHQLSHLDEPLPVVFDDVLVNFDDQRTAVALRTLASLGSRTQVVLFTHHAGVVAAAEAAIEPGQLAVRRLAPRDHGSPPSAQGVPRSAPRRAGLLQPASTARRSGTDCAEAILDVVRRVGRAVSKAEILAAAEIPEERWPQAIRRLVDAGSLVQEGVKRGARYRTASG